MISNRDTDWDLSAKGNWWRRENGTPLIVGISKYGLVWPMVDGDFIDEAFDYLEDVQIAAELEVNR